MVARQRLKPLGKRVKFVTADFAAAAATRSYDAVVSALAIHHLPDSGKRHLFFDIFKYLTLDFSQSGVVCAELPATPTVCQDRCGNIPGKSAVAQPD
jgi:hypothetical protein